MTRTAKLPTTAGVTTWPIGNVARLAPAVRAELERIVEAQAPWIETLETRNRDSLDFVDVSKDTLVRLMASAFLAGSRSAAAALEGR